MTACMRRAARSAGVLIGCVIGASAAHADHEPVIAVPGNWQVPVVIDGMPATGGMVIGDWGLYAPGRMAPEVLGPVLIPNGPPPAKPYFPMTGRLPHYGRQEVQGRRHHYPPAPSYYRSWTSQSDSGPVTNYPPYDPPPVIMAPQGARRPHGVPGVR